MKILENNVNALWSLIILLVIGLLVSSCSKKQLEIEQNFQFDVQVMPVPKAISNGETVEIRLTITPSGNYDETQYFLRFFQYDGTGELRYYQEEPYQPNDLYLLVRKQFRLYYTSTSTLSHSFDVWISDSFGNERQLNFEFKSSD
jgi:hypothetical protein